jgi:serine phosphatase RsbU (regulator of sigma subunit)
VTERSAAAPAAVEVRPRRSIHSTTVIVAAVGLVVSLGLMVATWTVRDHNEDRLLDQRVREAAAVLTSALPSVETPLASAAELVEATGAEPASFRHLLSRFVGPRGPFVSASVWSATALSTQPLVVAGRRPSIAGNGGQVADFVSRTKATPGLSVFDRLSGRVPRLGYSDWSGPGSRFLIYAEAALPPDRTATVQQDSAFADLRYALYLGRRARPRSLLAASTSDLPFAGRTAAATVPLGDTYIHLVITSEGRLGGTLLWVLPWIILGVGLAVTLGAAGLTERLLRERDDAEHLADRLQAVASENEQLYAAQRDVAHTLQQSLLPQALPDVSGIELAARYQAGVEGVEIGGDWYDVIEVDDGRLLLVVGDVSGRGVDAATTMARIRYSIRAYAAQGDSPPVILDKVSRLIDIRRDDHFATVLCAWLDVAAGTASIANAGHPPPLLLDGSGARFLDTDVDAPLGVPVRTTYRSATVDLPRAGTVLLYTDGLFERRGETVDVGHERLRMRAEQVAAGELEVTVTSLLAAMSDGAGGDDTAILGVRWRTTEAR